jgi:hypothetical protein
LDAKNTLGIRSQYSIPKSGSEYPNEDFYAISELKGLIALCDGASISYDSATWARLVAVHFVQNPRVSKEWIAKTVKEFELKHKRETMSWMAQAAYDRGSFTSLLGIKFGEAREKVEIIAIGDSIAVLCDGDTILASYPYTYPEQFDEMPILVSTDHALNIFLNDENFPTSKSVCWDISSCEKPIIFCVTDALGRWILSERQAGRHPIEVLRSINSHKHFERFVEVERASGKMHRDDTTMLVLQ